MVLLLLILAGGAVLGLYRYFRSRIPRHRWLLFALMTGTALGSARAVLTALGFLGVQHTAAFVQVPAYPFALLGWPELILLGPHHGPPPRSFYLRMALLLIATTATGVVAIAFVAQWRRQRREG